MTTARNATRLSTSSWLILIGLACVTAVLSLGTHDLAISYLGVPFPDNTPPAWAKYVAVVVRIAAVVQLCRLGGWYLDRHGRAFAAIAMGMVFVCFNEVLRSIIVNYVLVDGWVDGRWISSLLEALPKAADNFSQGAIAALIARDIARERRIAVTIAVLASAAFIYFALVPGTEHLKSVIYANLSLSKPPELHEPAFGLRIDAYIYGTFIETTAAAFVLAWISWPGLQGSTARRVTVFATLLLLAHGRVVGTFLLGFWSSRPLIVAIAAYGQFFAETLVQAVLIGLSWTFVSRRPRGAEPVQGLAGHIETPAGR